MPPLNKTQKVQVIIQAKVNNEDYVEDVGLPINLNEIEHALTNLRQELKTSEFKNKQLIQQNKRGLIQVTEKVNSQNNRLHGFKDGMIEQQKVILDEHNEQSLLHKYGKVIGKRNSVLDTFILQKKLVNSMEFLNDCRNFKREITSYLNNKDYFSAANTWTKLKHNIELDRVENNSLIMHQTKEWTSIIQTQMIGYIQEEMEINLKLNQEELIINKDFSKLDNECNNQRNLSRIEQLFNSLNILQHNVNIDKLRTYLNNKLENIIKNQLNIKIEENKVQFIYKGHQEEVINKVLKDIIKFIKFVQFQFQSLFEQLFPDLYYEESIYKLIINNLIQPRLPSSKNGIQQFYKANIEAIKQFENSIKQLKLFKVETSLINYSNNLESSLLDHQQIELLSLVRAVLNEDKLSTVEINQVEITADFDFELNFGLPLILNNFKTPDTIIRIIVSLEHALLEGLNMDEDSSKKVYYSIRHSIDLYLAMLPNRIIKFQNQLSLIHNEMIYLLKELLRLSYMYQPKYKCNMELLDFIKVLLKLAHQTILQPVKELKQNLLNKLQSNKVINNLELDKNFKKSQLNMKQIMTSLQQFIKQMKELDANLLNSIILYHIILPVNEHFINTILQLEDIGDKESQNINLLLKDYISFTLDKFKDHDNIIKLNLLVNTILIGSLKEIESKLNILLNYFTKDQIRLLVLALFNISENRDNFIDNLNKY